MTEQNLKEFLLKKGFKKIPKIGDNFNLDFLQPKRNGVYVFLVNEAFPLNYVNFMREVKAHFLNEKRETEEYIFIVPETKSVILEST